MPRKLVLSQVRTCLIAVWGVQAFVTVTGTPFGSFFILWRFYEADDSLAPSGGMGEDFCDLADLDGIPVVRQDLGDN